MNEYISQRGKAHRAFRAYQDVLDTAEWFRRKVRDQLETFELTLWEFRVLELVYRQGPLYTSEAARWLQTTPHLLERYVRLLERKGWIQREASNLEVSKETERRISRSRRPQKGRGRRVMQMTLTPEGAKWVLHVFPSHAKVVKALMRALDGREQETLSRLCRKLRKGDAVKFYREMVMQEDWETLAEAGKSLLKMLQKPDKPGKWQKQQPVSFELRYEPKKPQLPTDKH